MNGGAVTPVVVEVRLPRWVTRLVAGRHGVVVAGLGLIAVVTALKAVALGGSYFFEDDLVFIAFAAERPLDWEFLTRVHIGHLMPGGYALVWVVARLHAYDWILASGMILLLHVGAGLAFLRLLLLLFGRRWLVLLPLVVALLAPSMIQVTTWMAVAINIVPLQIVLCLALCSTVRLARGQGARHGLAALAWTLLGLVFFEKAVVIPVVLLAVTAWFLVDRGWVTGLGEALRRFWWLWLAQLCLLAGYGALYLSLQDTSGSTGLGLPDVSVAADYGLWFLVQTVPLLVTGAPIGWAPGVPVGPVVGPEFVTVVFAWVVAVAVVAVTVRHRRRAWRAWVLAGGFLIFADGLITLLARARFYPEHAFESRYIADSVPLVALCVALALIPMSGEDRPWLCPPPAGRHVVATLVATCYAVSTIFSAAGFVRLVGDEVPRVYVENARADVARLDDLTQVYPTLISERVLFPWHGVESRLTSFLLVPAMNEAGRERLGNPRPAYRGVTFDEEGRLRPARIFGGFVAPDDGARCLPLESGRVLTVALHAEQRGNIARIVYRTREPVGVTVRAGSMETPITLAPEHGQVFLPVPVYRDDLRITVERGSAEPCLQGVAVGVALPEEEPGGAPPEKPGGVGGGVSGAGG